jgi:hypothetical protein
VAGIEEQVFDIRAVNDPRAVGRHWTQACPEAPVRSVSALRKQIVGHQLERLPPSPIQLLIEAGDFSLATDTDAVMFVAPTRLMRGASGAIVTIAINPIMLRRLKEAM